MTQARAPAPVRRRRARGISLLEVLVAILILSFGLLGLAALQARALKGNVSSLQRSQAVMLSHYALDLMRVDRAAAKTGDFNTPGAAPACDTAAIVGTTLAHNNLRAWLTALKANIGRAGDTTTCGRVVCTASTLVCEVHIQWDDSASGGLSNQTLVITSRL